MKKYLLPLFFMALLGYVVTDNYPKVDTLKTVNTDATFQPITVAFDANSSEGGFSIESKNNVKEVKIYNLLGRHLRTFSFMPNQQYNLRGLPDGVYLAGLVDENGHTQTTIRLKKHTILP